MPAFCISAAIRPTPVSSPSGNTYRSMNPPRTRGEWIVSGLVMQWLSSRPPGRSRSWRNRKYDG